MKKEHIDLLLKVFGLETPPDQESVKCPHHERAAADDGWLGLESVICPG